MMRVLHGFDDLPALRNPVVTVGSFDGVHAGHRALLEHVVRLARLHDGESVVVTFAPHPRAVLGNRGEELKLLNTPDEKRFLLACAGIDNLIVVPFTEAFSRMSYEDFVRDCLVGKLGAKTLVVGFDHRFGRGQEGDPASLDRLRLESGFEVYEVPKQEMDAGKVSSTAIRRLIGAGDMAHAERMLGHPYILIVAHGDGAKLLAGDPYKLVPPPGAYPVAAGDPQCAVDRPQKHTLYIGADNTFTLEPPAAGNGAQNNLLITFLSH